MERFTKEEFDSMEILIRDDFPNLIGIVEKMKEQNNYLDKLVRKEKKRKYES